MLPSIPTMASWKTRKQNVYLTVENNALCMFDQDKFRHGKTVEIISSLLSLYNDTLNLSFAEMLYLLIF